MKLNNDYWHQMDRNSECCASDVNVNSLASNIGISHGMGDLVQGMKSKVFAGASHVELGFTGRGKGSIQQPTPGTFGSEQRRDIRQMSKINDVSVSTHATVAVTGLAGRSQDGFSDEEQEQNLHEIKRATEFAADTAEGGAVVFHVGEFPRPLAQYPHFEFHPREKERMVHSLVDKHTGRIIQQVKEDEKIYEPLIDNKGNFIRDEKGQIQYDIKTFKKFMPEEEDREKAAKEFFLKTLEAEKQQAKGVADEYELRYEKGLELKDKYKKKLDEYEYVKSITPPEKWEEMKTVITRQDEPLLGPEVVDPVNFLQKKVGEIEKEISFAKERVVSSKEQARKVEEYEERIQDIKSYATQRSADALARAAMHAYHVTEERGLKKPIFIAPENLFPEWGYGNHPQELKEMVIDSREAMVNYLKKEGHSESEARKISKDHINATFDIAHANLWKKFWKGDPKKTIEENNRDFDKWIVGQADELNKAGVIGHVHLSDNFGYGDEHLSTGHGNTPVKEFLEAMRKGGFKGKSIAEIGAQPQGKEHEAMTETWKHVHDLFSPIYRTDVLTRTWGDTHQSYFAHTRSPDFLVGEAVPNPQEWVLYSGVPLE